MNYFAKNPDAVFTFQRHAHGTKVSRVDFKKSNHKHKETCAKNRKKRK